MTFFFSRGFCRVCTKNYFQTVCSRDSRTRDRGRGNVCDSTVFRGQVAVTRETLKLTGTRCYFRSVSTSTLPSVRPMARNSSHFNGRKTRRSTRCRTLFRRSPSSWCLVNFDRVPDKCFTPRRVSGKRQKFI